MIHKYKFGQICIFTNKGSSGVTSNDGLKCEIIRLKPLDEWVYPEPAYVIIFEDGRSFGVRQSELEPVE